MTHSIRPTSHRAPLRAVLALALLTLGASCGKEQTTEPPPAPTGGIVVTPADAVVFLGDTLRFTATLSGISGGVLWRLAPGNSATTELGAISADGLYHAPASGSGNVDFEVLVTAKSAADSSITGTVLVRIPRIQVLALPGFLTSVPPGSDVPYTVEVRNALDPSFELLVEGVLGGDATVGFFEATGPTSAVYRALDEMTLSTGYSLLVRSTQSPTGASATPFLSVRRGFQLAGDPGLHQMSPEWEPNGTKVAYAEGPPWSLVLHTPATQGRTTIASIDDPTALYDGRISWSPSGDWLCFPELSGGRPVLGIVGADGSGRATFDPDGVSEVLDGAFLPTDPADPESLLVILRTGTTYRLRAYPLSLSPGEPGVAVYEPPAGTVLRHPDAARFDGVLHVCLVRTVTAVNQVLGFAVTGGPLDIVETSPGSTGPASRPLWTPQAFIRRITYLSGANSTAYRFTWGGATPPVRLYAEFFPEQAIDRVEARPDDVVMSRLHPDGYHRAWVVEFPPPDYLPKPAEEEELRAAGAWRAWTPAEWERWKTQAPPVIAGR